MRAADQKDHHGDPELCPSTKEKTLELLASLLASTLDGQASVSDVQRALNISSGDDDAWRVRVAECSHARQHEEANAEAGPSPNPATQEWVCPMCETVNWAPDARKSLRRRAEDSASATLPSTQLRCACCGYGGAVGEEEEEDGCVGEAGSR